MKYNRPAFAILVAAVLLLFGLGAQAADNANMLKQAKESLQAVEALNSAVSSGVTRTDYIKRKADAQIAVDKFTNEYGKNNQFAECLIAAMAEHELADCVWAEYFKCDDASHNFIPVSVSSISYLIKMFPDLNKYVSHFTSGDELYVPSTLSYFWSGAEKETTAARKILNSAK